MGFSDFGRSIISNNRRLQQSIRSKYYQYQSSSQASETHDSAEGLSKDKIQKNDRIKRRANLKKLSLIGLVSIISLAVIFRLLFKSEIPSTQVDSLILMAIKENAVAKEKIKAYNYWIAAGSENLDRRNYDLAYKEFHKALEISPNGKRANVGLTSCLLMRCKMKHENCEMVRTHYENLVRSNVLNEEQLSFLTSLTK